jgi:hypothetical protein
VSRAAAGHRTRAAVDTPLHRIAVPHLTTDLFLSKPVRPLLTPYLDWAVTVIFYATLHYLRALFARHHVTNIARYGDMDKAFERLAVVRNEAGIYNDYRQLKDDSRDARYNMWRPTLVEVVDFRDGELDRIRSFVLPRVT